MTWNLIDLAWAGGLFEGEGCFSAQKAYASPRAAVKMTDEDIIRKFHAIVGIGTVCIERNGRFKPTWNWQVQSFHDTQFVAALLWRFLGPRRKAAIKRVLQGYLARPKKVYRGQLSANMVAAAFNAAKFGRSQTAIAHDMGVSPSAINKLLRGHTYTGFTHLGELPSN